MGREGAFDLVRAVEPLFASCGADQARLRSADDAIAKIDIDGDDNRAKADAMPIRISVRAGHRLIPAALH